MMSLMDMCELLERCYRYPRARRFGTEVNFGLFTMGGPSKFMEGFKRQVGL